MSALAIQMKLIRQWDAYAGMATDSRRRRIPVDDRRINLEDPEEVRHWCRQLGCSEWRLRDAVTYVGFLADDVRACLAMDAPLSRAPDSRMRSLRSKRSGLG